MTSNLSELPCHYKADKTTLLVCPDLTDHWCKHNWCKVSHSLSTPVTSLWARVSYPSPPAFFFFVSRGPSPAPFICHFSTNISLSLLSFSLSLLQSLWRPVLSAQGGRFFMWKQVRSSWGGIHSQVLGFSCRAVSLPQKPCPLPQSYALLSPTAQLRGNALRHLTNKQISYRESPWTRGGWCCSFSLTMSATCEKG